jgi:D-arabinose 1-dehydrogenase-like Zn-dependent alcohol dehydrogenase
MCAGATIYSSIKRCNLSPGDWLVISGCGGGLGHLGIQFAKALGYHVVGVDTRPAALKLAESLGACDLLVDASKSDAKEVVRGIRGGRGAHAAVILPEVQVAFDFAVGLLGLHGTMCVVSFPNEGFRFSCSDVVFRDIKIIGTSPPFDLVGWGADWGRRVDWAAGGDEGDVGVIFEI